MKTTFRFLVSVLAFLIAFYAFNGFTSQYDLVPDSTTNVASEPFPGMYQFIHYAIAVVTGLVALFIRRLVKKWFPDFPDEKQ